LTIKMYLHLGSRRSTCVIAVSSLFALALASCTSSEPMGETGGSGGAPNGAGGATGEGGAAGSPGSGGTGASGLGGGTGAAGRGGAAGSGSGGMSGASGAGGVAVGGRTGAGGRVGVGGAAGAGIGGSPNVDGGVASCTPAPTTYPNLFVTVSGHTQADSDTKVANAWSKLFDPSGSGSIYFNGPGADESYVQDIYNNDVRTEGMSYGMMIAVQLNHQTEFDRLWTWVTNHMAQGTGQIAWNATTSGQKKATGGAPDGDEYFATALIFAHNRWGDTSGKFNYATEAQWVLKLLRTQEFNQTNHIVEFSAGAQFTDGSYVLPAFYEAWACFDTANAAFWTAAAAAGRNFFHSAADSNGVIGDQSNFNGQTTKGPGSDTIRCVANIMMDHNFFNVDPWQTMTYAPAYGAYEMTRANGVAQQSCNALLGFGLPASTGKAFVDKLWSTNVPNHDYWNGVLYMLAMLHVSGTFHLWY
jgi:oligosaccharide reducing-end xylanase